LGHAKALGLSSAIFFSPPLAKTDGKKLGEFK
jgi:hypothetical protein